jgi:hypothetical protein
MIDRKQLQIVRDQLSQIASDTADIPKNNKAKQAFREAECLLDDLETAEDAYNEALEQAQTFADCSPYLAVDADADADEADALINESYVDDCYDEGEALASAGFGTDEDYGCYYGEEW